MDLPERCDAHDNACLPSKRKAALEDFAQHRDITRPEALRQIMRKGLEELDIG